MNNGQYTIHLAPGHLQRDFELPFKGYARDVRVEAADGRSWLLYFTDLARLRQDLDDAQVRGVSHFTEHNLVVLAEVTLANIRQAVDRLWESGYFNQRPEPHAPMLSTER